MLSALSGWLMLLQVTYSQVRLADTLEIEEVVVTGSKVAVNRDNLPMTVSVIHREELENSGESALLPVISEQVPGLFITERGVTGFGVADGSAGQINLRGLGGNPTTQVLILIDGDPQFMGLMGHHLPDAYVTSDAERVEVLRGPASVLYGSNAFGGAINIITRKQKSDGLSVRAITQYGSWNTQKYMGSVGYKKERFSVFASINHDHTDGHRDSSDFSIMNVFVKSGYEISSGLKITADISMADYQSSDPGPVGGPAGERIDIFRGKTAISLENEFNRTQGACKLYYNFGEHSITDGWHSRDEMYGLMLYQTLKPVRGTMLTLGYDFMQYGGKGSPITTVLRDEDGNVIMPPQFELSPVNNTWIDASDHALYVFVQQELPANLVLNSGIRYEMNDTYGNEWIPQVGLAWKAGKYNTFKSSLSKGYRPPSIRELYLFPPANEALEPERMVNFEASWSRNWADTKMHTELTAFIAKGDNLIVAVPPIAPPPPLYMNTGAFLNKGLEFSWRYRPSEVLNLNANYTYINMRDPLPATPGHSLFLSATCKFRNFRLQMKLQDIFDLVNDNGEGSYEVIEESYHLLGTRISYRVNRFVDIYVQAHNLLNQQYQINFGYPMPGVAVYGGLSLRYDPKSSS